LVLLRKEKPKTGKKGGSREKIRNKKKKPGKWGILGGGIRDKNRKEKLKRR